MSKGNRKRKQPPAQTIQPDRPSPMQMGLFGFPASVTLNEQHLHQHISGDLANTLQVVNQMAPDMREQAMEMARKEQQHRHEQEEKINGHIYILKQDELAANKELQEKHMRNIFLTDMFGKVVASIAFISFIGAMIYMAVSENYYGMLALSLVATALVAGLNGLAYVLGKNGSANKA